MTVMNAHHHPVQHMAHELEDDFRRGSLKYLILLFAALIICMSLMEPKHVNFVYEHPYADSGLTQ